MRESGKVFSFFLFFSFLISISFFFLNLTSSTRHSKTHQCLLFSQMLRGLSGAMDVTDFSIVEQWLPRAKAAVAEGPRLEAERAARPCVTWPTERFEAAVKELATEKQRRGGEGQEQVLLISEGGGQGQKKAAEGVEEARAAAADATASASAASAALPSPPPLPPPPPAGTRTTDRPPRASSSSSAATATAAIKPTQVTPEVPSTVAYSAAVVGAAPTHLQELVESEKKKKDDSASESALASASAAAAATTTEAPKAASVPSPVARPSAESSRAKGMRLSFRAVPALDFVAVEREGEKDEREEVGAAATKA